MRKALWVLVASTLTMALAMPLLSPEHRAAAEPAAARRPNIILIVTDDQRFNTLQTMPKLRKRVMGRGADYLGIVPTSLCCPSRGSILTGNYSHTTRVYNNKLRRGGWPAFKRSGYERKTIATALNGAGYRTGYWGKYLNFWNRARAGYVPPGWDVFSAFYSRTGQGAGGYYDYQMRGTYPTQFYGGDASQYSTRQLTWRAERFIDSTPRNVPYLAVIAPFAPHSPFTALPRDKGSFNPAHVYNNAGVNERNMRDKPSFMQGLDRVSRKSIEKKHILTGEVLRAVDRMVAHMLAAADMSNTLLIYTSDNGVMWGDHRLGYKDRPYHWASRVPLFMRWDRRIDPGTQGMVANIDIAPTILDAAGIPDALTMEGDTVLDGTRKQILLESGRTNDHPAYCGLRTRRYLYVRYANGERELYDYTVDPHELHNKAGTPAYSAIRDSLRQKTIDLCKPKPPHFTWNP